MIPLFLSAFLLLIGAPAPGQRSDTFSLSLNSEYGRALYRQCRLSVVAFRDEGRGQLYCTLNIDPPKAIYVDRKLTSAEVKTFADLVSASSLCSGGHLGQDTRASDGMLETLLTNCAAGQVAVLVTSGNPTFKTDGARRQLLERLHAIEQELRKSAPPPK